MTYSVITLDTYQVGIPLEKYQVDFGYRDIERPNLYQRTFIGLKVGLRQELHHLDLVTVCNELSLVPELALHSVQELARLGMFKNKLKYDLAEIKVYDLDLTDIGLEFQQKRALPSKLKEASTNMLIDPFKLEFAAPTSTKAQLKLEDLPFNYDKDLKLHPLADQAVAEWIKADYKTSLQQQEQEDNAKDKVADKKDKLEPKVHEKQTTKWKKTGTSWRDIELTVGLVDNGDVCFLDFNSNDDYFNAYLDNHEFDDTVVKPLISWIEEATPGYQTQKRELDIERLFSEQTLHIQAADKPLLPNLPELSNTIHCYDDSKKQELGITYSNCVVFSKSESQPRLDHNNQTLYLPQNGKGFPKGMLSVYFDLNSGKKYTEELGWLDFEKYQFPLRVLQETNFSPNYKPEYLFSTSPLQICQEDFSERFVEQGLTVEPPLLEVWAFMISYLGADKYETYLPQLTIDQAESFHSHVKQTWNQDFRPDWLVNKILPLTNEEQVKVYDNLLGRQSPLKFTQLEPKLQGKYLAKSLSAYDSKDHRFAELEPINALSLQLQVFNNEDFKATAVIPDNIAKLEQWLDLSQELRNTYDLTHASAFEKREKVFQTNLDKIRNLFHGQSAEKFAIFDTNFLIDKVDNLKNKLASMFSNSGYKLVIPAVVTEELKSLETKEKQKQEDLEASLKTQAEQIEKKEAEIEEKQKQEQENNDNLTKLKEELSAPRTRISELEEKIKELQKQRTLRDNDYVTAQRAFDNAEKKAKKAAPPETKKSKKADAKSKAAKAEEIKLTPELAALKEQLDKALAARDAKRTEITELSSELDKEREGIKDREKQVKALDKELGQLSKEQESLQKELSTLKKQELELQGKLDSTENRLYNLRKTQRDLQQGDFSFTGDSADEQILKMLPLKNFETADAKILAVTARYKLCQVELYTSDKELANYAKSLNIVVRNSFA